MLSPQDFARLLQDKLIEAGEQRAVEFRADLFGFVPRGGEASSIFPLDNYYRMYLSAATDAERQRSIKHFTSDWLRHAKAGAPVAPSWGGAPPANYQSVPPIAYPPAPLVVPNPMAPGPPPGGPSAFPSYRPRSRGHRGVPMILATLAFLVFGTCLFSCVIPGVMMRVAKDKFKNMPGRPGPAWNRDGERDPPPNADVTEFAGGRGGQEKYFFDPGGRPVIGLAYSTGEWSREPVIGSLLPLYDARDVPNDEFGRPLRPVRANEGYVVGGLEVDAGEFVNAVRITFVRQTVDGLDLSDTYQSEWLGTPTAGREPRQLAGGGEIVLGVAARQGIILDSVGLLFREAPPAEAPVEQPPTDATAPPVPDLTPLLPDSWPLTPDR